MVGGSGALAPERDDAFEAKLAALVLKHQGRAPPASALVRVGYQGRKPCWGLCSPDGGRRRAGAQAPGPRAVRARAGASVQQSYFNR